MTNKIYDHTHQTEKRPASIYSKSHKINNQNSCMAFAHPEFPLLFSLLFTYPKKKKPHQKMNRIFAMIAFFYVNFGVTQKKIRISPKRRKTTNKPKESSRWYTRIRVLYIHIFMKANEHVIDDHLACIHKNHSVSTWNARAWACVYVSEWVFVGCMNDFPFELHYNNFHYSGFR